MKQTAMGKHIAFAGLATFMVVVAALFALVPSAFANTIEKQWTVEFTGTEMKDDGSAAIARIIGGMQPGDSAKFTVDLYESYDGAADWYMKNEVLKTMEKSFTDANSNSGGSYSYKLTFINPAGEEKVILTNEVVSGDAGSGTTKGLFDATEATGDWFFLETLAAKARAKVILEVSIDGETHGNTYFDTNAVLQLSFAAEPNATDPGVPGNGGDTPKDEEKPTQSDKPEKKLSQTGDTIRMGIIALIVALAGVVLVTAIVRRRKNDQDSKEGDAR
ncbi:hypothetical protein VIN30_01710 [Adlercreutzia sp. R7]|uniref:LPXTG cell wall anchor domain-containing protein n=1 Tax=Adlercreutzia wanghongyangiae TaxID=3111451 RepID=A0ABU6IFF7_9ACTN|nr:hypothetical protein [Adlercreutzia sp. R7]